MTTATDALREAEHVIPRAVPMTTIDTPDRDLAAACVRAWLHNPRPVRFQARTGIVRYRQAAELRAAGLSYKQIAEVMRCSEAAVGNFLRRARQKQSGGDTP